MKKTTRNWLIGVAISALIVFMALGWLYNRMTSSVFNMTNQVYQEAKSPGGNYVATLAYRDGPTYGFYYVTLQPLAGWHRLRIDDPIPDGEVTEAAAEGVDGIAWSDAHTLIVTYEKSGAEAAQLARQQRTWHDVRIIYRGV